jgi:hypothetical protein
VRLESLDYVNVEFYTYQARGKKLNSSLMKTLVFDGLTTHVEETYAQQYFFLKMMKNNNTYKVNKHPWLI